MNKLTELKAILEKLPQGSIPLRMKDKVLELLEGCWDKFEGSGKTKMEVGKIRRDDGPNDLAWAPRFVVDARSARRGRNGLKPCRAANMDAELETMTAIQGVSGYRQLTLNSPKLDVTSIVKAICEAAQRGPTSPSDLIDRGIVEWSGNEEIRVKHAILIPNVGPKDTISGRRKRLREKLKSELKAIGWEQVSIHQWITFKRADSSAM